MLPSYILYNLFTNSTKKPHNLTVEIFLDSYFYFPFSLYPDIKYDREIVQVYIVQHMYNFKAECDKLHILSFNGGNNWTAKKILRKNYFFKTYQVDTKIFYQ